MARLVISSVCFTTLYQLQRLCRVEYQKYMIITDGFGSIRSWPILRKCFDTQLKAPSRGIF